MPEADDAGTNPGDSEDLGADEELYNIYDDSKVYNDVTVVCKEKSKTKYYHALQTLKPYRKRVDKNVFPLEQVGLLSYVTVYWLNGFVWGVYKAGAVQMERLWPCPKSDGAHHNAERMARLWQEEVQARGEKEASMFRVMLRFIRTRLIVQFCVQIITLTFSFLGPAFLVKALLEYAEDSTDTRLSYGLALVLAFFVCELLKSLAFVTQWLLNYRTAMRLRSGTLHLVYVKILRLRSLKDKTVGQFVNIFTNDGQRLIEACVMGPMVLGGPLVVIAATIYCCWLLSPWALVGTFVFALFYPYQFLISRLTAYLRRMGIRTTDRRVRMMVEILTSIKLIKLYAWEKAIAKKVAGIRDEERSVLEKAAYVHTMSVAFLPMVPVFASVLTFTAHILAGNTLTASQWIAAAGPQVTNIRDPAVMAVFFMMRQKVLNPFTSATKALSELVIGAKRMKDVLIMEERAAVCREVDNQQNALEIHNATFAWDSVQTTDKDKEGEKSKQSKSKEGKSNSSSNKKPTTDTVNGISEAIPLNCEENSDSEASLYTDVLFDIDLKIPKGCLYGVCGAVGSGKSSLLAAILNHMVQRSGRMGVQGSVAYVSQQAWIMNKTLMDNILFGKPFDQDRYAEVLERCNLLPDLHMLPGGDLTEIGERGINLSGGQKQRVSLARALYADTDVYLLDDPLSAVDPHVGQHLFTQCIRGALKDKTVVFVTHQLQYLNQCDHILLLKDGRIHETGTHAQLMSLCGEYAALIEKFYSEHAQTDKTPEDTEPTLHKVDTSTVMAERQATQATPSEEKLIDKEKVEKGEVTASTYMAYFKAAGGLLALTVVVLTFALPVATAAFSNWWLSYWIAQGSGQLSTDTLSNTVPINSSSVLDGTSSADDNSREESDEISNEISGETRTSGNISDNPGVYRYVSIYCATIVMVVIFTCIRGFVFMKVTLRASTRLHDAVFAKVLRSPMSFFDTTPVGRILNRFSKDLDDVDTRLPLRAETLLQHGLLVLTSLVIVAVVFPYFLLAAVPMAVLFYFLYRAFRVVLREVKRAENVSRSPWISHIATTVQGLVTISAYNAQQQFTRNLESLADAHSLLHFLLFYVMRWLALRLDLIALTITSTTALFIVLTKNSVNPAYAGLAIAYAAQLTGMFQYTVRMLCEVQATFSSVERLQYYTEFVDTEAPPIVDNYRPPPDWPSQGSVTFKDVDLRYRPGLPLVLRGVTLNIQPREKIGIVGRTGSGKSSLGVALFRLVEPSQGSIVIDDMVTARMGLDDLRSRMSIIPQDPVLFVGTVRYNLDPFEEHDDSDLWTALDRCHVKDVISGLEGGLGAAVLENGENFSVGERQLMCMARALLRRSQILLLDEATAAIDTETDSRLQTTIRDVFAQCTLLTIAHRLNTVLDSDRILVMSDGQVAEFDTPAALLANEKSIFYTMVNSHSLPSS